MNRIRNIIISLLAVFMSGITTGCFYTTRYVSRIGKTHEHFNSPVAAYVFPDNSIVAEASATYYREVGSEIFTPSRRVIENRQLWILVTSKTVELYARSRGSNRTILSEGVRIALEYPSFRIQVLPSDFRGVSTEPPLDISQAVAHYSKPNRGAPFYIPVTIDDQTFLFYLRPDSERTKRSIYAYPLLVILVPPAVAFDIITLPIQTIVAIQEFNSMF